MQRSNIEVGGASQFSPSPDLVEALQRRGDLVLRGSSLEAALFTINELWKVNIVAGQVEGQVNGVFKDAPLKEILDTILDSNGLGYRLVGESIVIIPVGELGPMNPFFTSAAIPVNNVLPSTLVEAVSLLSTPQGQVRAVDSAHTLIVVDLPERVQKIRELTVSIDAASGGEPGVLDIHGKPKPLEVGYFPTQYVSASEAKKVLGTVLSTVGRTESMEGEDRLVIVDYAENLQMARRVLEQVDRPRPQVRITTLIYDLTLEDIEEIGINWNDAIKFRPDANGDAQTVISADSVLQQPYGANSNGGTFTFLNLSTNFDLNAVVLALQNATDSRLLANPTVTVMNNERANFEAVREIPYQEINQTSNGGQLAGTAFKDAGIKLDVEPKIAADGTIQLMVKPEFSSLTGFTPASNQPIIDTRSTSTVVRIANGQTLVIGGMRQRNDVGDFSGIPGLKDIRGLGYIFRARSTNIRESELVVFITPQIVSYDEPHDCREQRVADTVRCRLDHIPVAEGCPQECDYGSAPVVFGDETYESTPMTPKFTEPLPQQPIELTPADAPIPAPEPVAPPVTPTGYDQSLGNQFVAPPRRLPPVAEERVVQIPAAPDGRLRPDFDSRFRATGGVYADQQRAIERPPESSDPLVDEPRTSTETSAWWKRLLMR
ncbi:MAG: secretin N-terminal domain-containing protein [Aeoliella sp.]